MRYIAQEYRNFDLSDSIESVIHLLSSLYMKNYTVCGTEIDVPIHSRLNDYIYCRCKRKGKEEENID